MNFLRQLLQADDDGMPVGPHRGLGMAQARSRYVKGYCRCVDCREANTLYCRHYRRAGSPQGKKLHGTRSSYTGGCRCPGCVEANRIYQRAYQHVLKPRIPPMEMTHAEPAASSIPSGQREGLDDPGAHRG